MADAHTIELKVPGLLQFRDVAMRVVMEACQLVGKLDTGAGAGDGDTADRDKDNSNTADTGQGDGDRARCSLSTSYEFDDQFTLEFTSAFSEVYNNIPIHAYEGTSNGFIDFTIRVYSDHLIVDIIDTGKCFDIDAIPPPDAFPMGGMGLHIARAMLDTLEYLAGPPNRWRLVKYVSAPHKDSPLPEASAHE